MNKKICIAIDAMSGEDSPLKNIEGINLFCLKNKNEDYLFNIFGDELQITNELKKYNISKEKFKIFHTPSIVSDDETPLTAIKTSKNTSMWNCVYSQIKSESHISLSAGNTGVLLVISRMILKTIQGVSKPALAGLWPNNNGMNIVLDLGANIECDENNLIEFSEMGSALYKSLFPNEKPKVALLNVGSEEYKGTDIIKKTYSKLKEISKSGDFLFNGYIEGNEITSGKSNVVVTDGFTGNIALKTAEGTARMIQVFLKNALNSSIISKLGAYLASFALSSLKDKLDPRVHNCGIFVGLNAPIIKCHGASDHIGITYAADLIYMLIKDDVNDKIKKNIEKQQSN